MFYLLIALAVASRLIPHPVNFTPVAALGMFVGAYDSKRSGLLTTLAVLLASDFLLGFYDAAAMAFVYGGFLLSALIGWALCRKERTPFRVAGASLAGSVVFFALSNFGSWLTPWYPHTVDGLVQCYVAAIPFFKNTVAANLVYGLGLFGLYEAARALRAAGKLRFAV